MLFLKTHSTHFIYGYMASDIWLRTILIVRKERERERNVIFKDALNTFYLRLRTILIARKETRCRHIGYSFRLTARVLLYVPSHRQDSTYHGLCYTSRGDLARMRNSSICSLHEGSIRRPIAPWATSRSLWIQESISRTLDQELSYSIANVKEREKCFI